jgi:predicted ATPase
LPPLSPFLFSLAKLCQGARSQDSLAFLVADLAREGHASRALLSSLGDDEAAALLEELLPEAAGEVRQQVLERAAGVPLFLVSCVQALQNGQLTQHGITHVPWTLREAILQRVVALQEDAHQVLRLAAVIGRHVPRAVLMALAVRSDLQEEAVVEGLEACVRARLLGEANGDA